MTLLHLSPDVEAALAAGRPVVALESTIISHGLPRPRNHEAALEFEQLLRDQGVTPATIAVLDGVPQIGLDADGVRAKFGVSPAQIPDYLGLVGDVVDNLPGVPGIGAKTAAAVLGAFGRIEAIPEDPAAWESQGLKVRGAAGAAARIAEHRDRALHVARVVEEMGKNFSGTGMDPNVIGYRGVKDYDGPGDPSIQIIAALRLHGKSQGNAIGVGLADFITRELRAAIDEDKTFINVFTTGEMIRMKIPATLPTDEELVKTIRGRFGDEGWMFIPNTLHPRRHEYHSRRPSIFRAFVLIRQKLGHWSMEVGQVRLIDRDPFDRRQPFAARTRSGH